MNADNSRWWPVNHRTKRETLAHYEHQAQLARATRAAVDAERTARMAVEEARRQRERADALARRVEVLVMALRAP